MQTYTKLGGQVLDLTDLGSEEQVHFKRCYDAYRKNTPFNDFANRLVFGKENPLLKDTGGVVTRKVWNHPLFQAIRDMEDRLGIQQGEVGAEIGDDLDIDPIADEWVPVSEAAERQGVTVQAVHAAIKREDIIARPARPGGAWLLVSLRSLEGWQPDPIRQAAAKKQPSGV